MQSHPSHISLQLFNVGRTTLLEGDFALDAAAPYLLLPLEMWKALCLHPESEINVRLPDGSIGRRWVSTIWVQCRGRGAAKKAILGGKDELPIVGASTLKELGFFFDSERHILRSQDVILL